MRTAPIGVTIAIIATLIVIMAIRDDVSSPANERGVIVISGQAHPNAASKPASPRVASPPDARSTPVTGRPPTPHDKDFVLALLGDEISHLNGDTQPKDDQTTTDTKQLTDFIGTIPFLNDDSNVRCTKTECLVTGTTDSESSLQDTNHAMALLQSDPFKAKENPSLSWKRTYFTAYDSRYYMFFRRTQR